MKLAAMVATLLAGALIAKPAHADLLLFSFTEPDSSTSWEQDSSPTPTAHAGSFTTINVQDGTETDFGTTNPVSSVTFFPDFFGGGFQTNVFLTETGAQLFTTASTDVLNASPTFAAGTFDLTDSNNGETGVLTVTDLSAPAVPEPASLVLLGTALAGFGLIRRGKRVS